MGRLNELNREQALAHFKAMGLFTESLKQNIMSHEALNERNKQIFDRFESIIKKIDLLFDTHSSEIFNFINEGKPITAEAKHMLLVGVTSDDDWTIPFYRNLINSGIPEFTNKEFIDATKILVQSHRNLVEFVRNIPTR